MDFEFSPEQDELRASVRKALSTHLPMSAVREQYNATQGQVGAAWAALSDIGVQGLLIAAEYGGLGVTMVDAAVVLEELGRAVAPLAYTASAITVATLLREMEAIGALVQLGPRLADGTLVATLAALEPGHRYDWARCATLANPRPDGTVSLRGTKVHVANGTDAHLLCVVARHESDVNVYTIDAAAAGVTVTAEEHLDGSRKLATVYFEDAIACPVAPASSGFNQALRRTFDATAIAHVVDAVGTASAALEMTLEYSKQRIAFDRPIGSFQAVQHICADMLRAIELGRAAALYACWAHDHASVDESHRAAMLAAAHCAQAFPSVGANAIQVFGGIGFTWEHDVQLFYKRLLSAGTLCGTAQDFLEELAVIAIDGSTESTVNP